MGKGAEITGGLLTLLGLVLFAVSFGTNFWYTFEISRRTTSVGLFMECVGETCVEIGWNGLQARIFFPRVFMIIASFLYGLGLLFHLISFCCQDGTKGGLIITGSTFYIIGALFNLAAPAVFVGYLSTDIFYGAVGGGLIPTSRSTNVVYEYSFYLAWASSAVILVASIVDCCAGCDAKQTRQEVVPQQVIWTTEIPQAQTILLSQTGRPTTVAQIPIPMPQVPPAQSINQLAEYQW